eukprot:CAMPEP_0194030400 /NCGR_PEP_ID=MMETSP0009_2-20130614/3904_1 /TAXON_ID=210454 /ORGANISM="Grammatophora oceanica, Strain CCMP 410" /LENGTH=256 /DNA_ID=CAMNT_0038670341 /DNA_START=84 /DNA_END=854 /DNA_ORIENTATION=+
MFKLSLIILGLSAIATVSGQECVVAFNDGVDLVLLDGEAYPDEVISDFCGSEFDCQCDSSAPGYVACRFCPFETSSGATVCAAAGESITFDDAEGAVMTCSCEHVEGTTVRTICQGTPESIMSMPIAQITDEPSASPTLDPTASPTLDPTATPNLDPTATPTADPTATPTLEPTATPTLEPTILSSDATTASTPEPTVLASDATTVSTPEPTSEPTSEPTELELPDLEDLERPDFDICTIDAFGWLCELFDMFYSF